MNGYISQERNRTESSSKKLFNPKTGQLETTSGEEPALSVAPSSASVPVTGIIARPQSERRESGKSNTSKEENSAMTSSYSGAPHTAKQGMHM